MTRKRLTNKRIRKGDQVVVIAGNDRGRTGEVLDRKGNRVLVKGINIRKKHMKRSETNPQGIVDIEVAIHASNIMLCAGEEKGVRTHMRFNDAGEKELCYRLNGDEVVHRNVKKQ